MRFLSNEKIWQRIDEFGEQICSPSQQPSAADLFYIFIFQNEKYENFLTEVGEKWISEISEWNPRGPAASQS